MFRASIIAANTLNLSCSEVGDGTVMDADP